VPKRLTLLVLGTGIACSRILCSSPESTSVLETFWRRFLRRQGRATLERADNHYGEMGQMSGTDGEEIDDNIVRDLYLFFELVCKTCPATWEPSNPTEGLSTEPSVWADQFSRKFAIEARRLGWGSIAGDVLCPECLAKSPGCQKAIPEVRQSSSVRMCHLK
jgi:hypothetical protein